MNRPFTYLALVAITLGSVSGQLVVSGNETKILLTSGAPVAFPNKRPDSLTFIDFKTFPPEVSHLYGVTNSVIGPPSNIAITPNGELALVADSLELNEASASGWDPASVVHVLDLTKNPPRIIGKVGTGKQPSGMSITPDGKLALVANRADGTVSILSIDKQNVRAIGAVTVSPPALSVSDVAVTPNGKRALVSVQKGGYLAVLEIAGETVTLAEEKVSAYGQPYRVVITPDGQLGLTAGQGAALNGLDTDALTVVDLRANPIRAIDHVPLGAVPESIELSPEGSLLAVVLMSGSHFAADSPNYKTEGELVILKRDERTYRVTQRVPIGRIPEGVAFTADGKWLLVQCHPDEEIRVFSVADGSVKDTGHRIKTPGMPSSIRAVGSR